MIVSATADPATSTQNRRFRWNVGGGCSVNVSGLFVPWMRATLFAHRDATSSNVESEDEQMPHSGTRRTRPIACIMWVYQI